MTARTLVARALASALCIMAASPAAAGDGWNGSRHGHGHELGHGPGHGYHHAGRSLGFSSPVFRLPGGTFSRSVWAARGNRTAGTAAPALAPRASIIHVDGHTRPDGASGWNGCSYEAGVCVIRPGS